MSIYDNDWGDVQPARTISRVEQQETGLVRRASNFVAPAPQAYPMPSRHEVIDPYAAYAPQPVQFLAKHEYTPITRAQSVLIRTSAVTVALAILTAAAMAMLDGWFFFGWLLLASLEWVFCFLVVSVLDWRETPAALTWKQSSDYMDLMRTEQAARLRALYGYEVE
jgi:hypothetical protein